MSSSRTPTLSMIEKLALRMSRLEMPRGKLSRHPTTTCRKLDSEIGELGRKGKMASRLKPCGFLLLSCFLFFIFDHLHLLTFGNTQTVCYPIDEPLLFFLLLICHVLCEDSRLLLSKWEHVKTVSCGRAGGWWAAVICSNLTTRI